MGKSGGEARRPGLLLKQQGGTIGEKMEMKEGMMIAKTGDIRREAMWGEAQMEGEKGQNSARSHLLYIKRPPTHLCLRSCCFSFCQSLLLSFFWLPLHLHFTFSLFSSFLCDGVCSGLGSCLLLWCLTSLRNESPHKDSSTRMCVCVCLWQTHAGWVFTQSVPRFVFLRTCHGCHVNREPSEVMQPHLWRQMHGHPGDHVYLRPQTSDKASGDPVCLWLMFFCFSWQSIRSTWWQDYSDQVLVGSLRSQICCPLLVRSVITSPSSLRTLNTDILADFMGEKKQHFS